MIEKYCEGVGGGKKKKEHYSTTTWAHNRNQKLRAEPGQNVLEPHGKPKDIFETGGQAQLHARTAAVTALQWHMELSEHPHCPKIQPCFKPIALCE